VSHAPTPGEELYQRLATMDWSRIILEISGRKRWRVTTIARHLNCNAQGLQRLARGDVKEPRMTLGLRLLDLHADVMQAGGEG
jgi:hypothetical protein